ncbi:MAG: LAGLIDADG family homing endonuclease, partial [Candidatus Nanohaloarchaea archaeon]
MPGDTEIVTPEGTATLAALFEQGGNGETVDRFGTEKVEVDASVVSYDRDAKVAEEKEIEAVYRASAQDHSIEVTTAAGRTIEVFPDHRMWTPDGVKRARELEEGDELFTQLRTPSGSSGLEKLDVLDFVNGENVMARNCGSHVDELVEQLGGLTAAAETAGISRKALDNYRRRDSIPVPVLQALEDAAGADLPEDITLAAKRDTVEVPRIIDRTAFSRLLGLYAAEGYARRSREEGAEFYQVNICYGEDELAALIEQTIEDVFEMEPTDADHEKIISSRIVYDLFQSLGAGEGAHTKQVPDVILGGADEHVKAFLSTYFAGDGSVEAGRLHVTCQSVSRDLLEGVGLLLQRFGMFYRIRESTRAAGGILVDKYGKQHYEGREFTSYKLHIRSEHAVSFGEEVGFALQRKQNVLENDYSLVRTPREDRMNDLVKDEITDIRVTQADEQYMYDIEVADNHNFATRSGVVSQNCDGDEDSIILLMDALLNFSRQFLPDQRGTRTMDAPLILSTVLHPDEVDDESWNVDVA